MARRTTSPPASDKADGSPMPNVRVPKELLDRVDALVPRVLAKAELRVLLGRVSRASVVKLALVEGLKVLERKLPPAEDEP